MRFTFLASLHLLNVVASSSIADRQEYFACNNSPDLCSRSYGNITQLGAHDSPFFANATTNSTVFSLNGDTSNQNIDSISQLTAGVRLLTAQVHDNNGSWHLCHTSCGLFDAGLLTAWLSRIKRWMDTNPHEVVTILLVNSDNASAADLHLEFQAANITTYVYVPPSTTVAPTTWPTLRDMIDNDTRLVTFVADLDPAVNQVAPYLLDEFTFIFENNYNITSLHDFTCNVDRPLSFHGNTAQALTSGHLPLLNHFLYQNLGFGIQAPDHSNITTTNGVSGEGSLGEAQSICTSSYGRRPSYLLIDFIDEGQALGLVDTANGIVAVGRGTIPSAVLSSSNVPSALPSAGPPINGGHRLEPLAIVFISGIAFWTTGLI